MIRRLVYFLAALCALYMWLAPRISSLPNSGPAWVSVAFFGGGLLLIVAALVGTRFGSRMAAIGSGIIVGLYCWSVTVMFLIRLGYYHMETRLVAVQESAIDRWRLALDRPVLFLLLFTALASLALSLSSIGKSEERSISDAKPG